MKRASASQVGEPAASEPYRLEEQVGFRLRRVHQRASEIFQSVMGRFELTPTQFAALAKLDDQGPVSQNELGRLTAMDPATIFGVVGRLAKRGLVVQRAARNDGRLIMIDLTDEGRRLIHAAKAVGAEVSERTLAPLDAREAALFLDLLKRLG